MNALYIIRKTALAAIAIAALGLSGCLRDSTDEIAPVRPEAEGVTINVSVPGMKSATRNVEYKENKISEMDVLVFGAGGVFLGREQARIIATELGGGPITQAYAPLSLQSGNTVVVVANARLKLNERLNEYGSSSFTLSDFRNDFVIPPNDSPLWGGTGAPPTVYLPMYGEAAVPAEAGVLNVTLTRVHACIEVVMQDAASKITSLGLNNYLMNGAVYPGTAPLLPNIPANPTTHPDYSMTYISGVYPLMYVFEAPAVDGSTPAAYQNSPYLLIRAEWNGNNYYYRINMTWDGSIPGTTQGEYMPILRNYRYKVVITSVDGPGYSSPVDVDAKNEGQASQGELNNLSYQIHVYDESAGGEKSKIVYNGNYYLALSQTEYTVPKAGTLGGKYLSLKIYTNYDYNGTGWKIKDSDDNLLQFTSGSKLDKLSGAGFTECELQFVVNSNKMGGDRELKFTVAAGQLSQVVTVKQSGTAMNAYLNQLPDAFEYYSWNGVLLEDYKSQLMLDWVSYDNTVKVVSIPDAAPSGTTYKPFNFSTAAGFDNLTGTHTYTGSRKLLNIAPAPAENSQDWAPYRSTIQITANGDSGLKTHNISVKHKNIYVALSVPQYVYVASEKLKQHIQVSYNTSFTISLLADPKSVTTGFYDITNELIGQYNNPFNYSKGEGGSASDVLFKTKSVSDIGTGSRVTFNISSSLYNGYNGPKRGFNFDIFVIPVGERANSYIVKPGDWVPAIPLSQANQTAELGSNWIELGYNGPDLAKFITAEIEWSDSPGVVELPFTPIRNSYDDYNTAHPNEPREAYLVVKGLKEGNAVVSVSQGGVKKWSWHIWVTADKDIIEAGQGSGQKWMDRNLGALASDSRVNEVYSEAQFEKTKGLFYQWGRKDPFPNRVWYYAGGTTEVRFYYGNNAGTTVTTVEQSVNNPSKIDYDTVSGLSGWRGSRGAASWYDSGSQTGKTVYDPCPYGWKVMSSTDWGSGTVAAAVDKMFAHPSAGKVSAAGYVAAGFSFTSNNPPSAEIWYNQGFTGNEYYPFYYCEIKSTGSYSSTAMATTNWMCNVRCVKER